MIKSSFEISSRPFHPILNKYIEKDLNKFEQGETIQYYHENDEIVGILFFDDQHVQRLLFVYKVKASFHDKKPIPFLYDIILPEFSLYRYDQEPKLLYNSRMDFILNKDSQSFECLNGTPLKITLTTINYGSHTLLKVTNCRNELIMFNTSLEMVKDPIKKIQGYLDLFNDIDPTLINELNLEDRIRTSLELIAQSKNERETMIREFSENPHVLDYLHKFRLKLYKTNSSYLSKQLIEEIIYFGFGMNSLKWKQLDESTFLYLISKENRETIHIIQAMSSDSDIHSLFKKLNSIQELNPEANLEIEFIGKENISKLDNLPVPSNVHLTSITFSNEVQGKITYKTFDYTLDSGFILRPPPNELHPFLYGFFQLSRYGKFDLEYDLANTNHGNYLIYAKAKKGPTSKVNEIRLIGFGIINIKKEFELQIEEDFKNLIKTMEKSLQTDPCKKAFFNRIVLQSKNPNIFPEEKLSVCLSYLVMKYHNTLKTLRVEKVIFKYSHNNYQKLIEYKNILGQNIKKTIATLDPNAPLKQVMTATNIETRELQTLLKDEIWAYRIPDLIQTVTKRLKNQLIDTSAPIEETFIELDLDHTQTVIHPTTGALDYNYGELISVSRPFGHNEAGVIIGLMTSDLGIGIPIRRVLIIGDLSHSSRGAIRGQECIRINAAIRYAAREKIPVDWYSASFGVQIHRERGVEGLDAAASTLREIVTNCHHKNVQINLIINETNVGAQSYWDSLAAIIYETTGILIMTPRGCMALTGPKALTCALYGTIGSEQIDYYATSLFPKGLQSLSGHELVHGPNSDSMLLAKNLEEAIYFLMLHHYYSYLRPAEKIVSQRLHLKENPIIPEKINMVRKEINNFLKGLKPNRNIILEHLRDSGSLPFLQFWADAVGVRKQITQQGDLPQEASTIVQEMLIGGHPTMVIFTPTGPLTPTDSDIIARAIYKASGRMQVLIIGSLSGFNCDPLSMGNRQLLEGAWIAKSIIDHRGPIIIFNLGSLVGGTFVVFNKQLNPYIKILAIEGAHVQVIGGKSAAKVVFHSLIVKQAEQDERVCNIYKQKLSDENQKTEEIIQKISIEKMNEIDSIYKKIKRQVIEEIENNEGILFDQFHNAHRAVKVRSIDKIISCDNMREQIILTFNELRASYLKTFPSLDTQIDDEYTLDD